MIGTLSRAKDLRAYPRFSLDLVTKIVDGPERNPGDLCRAQRQKNDTTTRYVGKKQPARDARDAALRNRGRLGFMQHESVYKYGKAARFVKSRSLSGSSSRRERRGTRVTNEHRNVAERASVFRDFRYPLRQKRRSIIEISLLLRFI